MAAARSSRDLREDFTNNAPLYTQERYAVKKNLYALCFFLVISAVSVMAFAYDTSSLNGNTNVERGLENARNRYGAAALQQQVPVGLDTHAHYYEGADAYISIPDSTTSELTAELENVDGIAGGKTALQ